MSPRLKVLCALAPLSFAPISAAVAQPSDAVGKVDKNAPLAAPIGLDELEKLIGGRTTLKFDFKKATATEIAAEISRQTGFKVTTPFVRAPLPDQPEAPISRYSLQANGQPFWEAILDWNRAVTPALISPIALPPGVTIALPPGVRFEPAPDVKIAPPTPEEFDESDGDPQISPLLGPGLMKARPDSDAKFELVPRSEMPQGRNFEQWPAVMIAYHLVRQQDRAIGLASPQTQASKTSDKANVEAPFRDRLRLRMRVFIEPKLRRVQLPMRCDITEAVDDKGQDLRLPWRSRATPWSHNPTEDVTITLLSRPQMGRKLARLRGVLRFVIVSQSQNVELNDLQKPFEQQIYRDTKVGTLRFNGLQREGTGWKLRFEAERSGEELGRWYGIPTVTTRFGDAQELSFLTDFSTSLHLYDGEGHLLRTSSGESQWSMNSEAGQTLNAPVSPPPPDITKWKFSESMDRHFSPTQFSLQEGKMISVGTPVRLVANLVTERREVSIPFEFKDLPLPPA